MEKYIVTIATNWYTTSGQIGNSPAKKLPVGYLFDSDKSSGDRRNVAGTNMWIPVGNCELNTTPIPDPDPNPDPNPDPIDPTQFDRIIMERISYDGGLTYGPWKYTGEKDLDG